MTQTTEELRTVGPSEGEQLATIPTEDAGAALPNGPEDLDIVRIFNPETEQYGECPRAGVKYFAGWEVVDPTPAQAEQTTTYDPSAHTAAEVIEFLESASAAEREAVLVLEQEGKSRKTVLEWQPSPEPDGDDS